MVFVILVSHEDPVKSTLGFHVAINHPEGKLIIYTAFYLKIQVEMDKAKSIKPCKKKNPGMIVHTCSIKNSIRMQTEFIYDIWLTPAVGRGRRGGDFGPYFNSFPPLIGQLRLLITCHVKLVLTLIVMRAFSPVYTCSPCCAPSV